jgi:hypothetical protein
MVWRGPRAVSRRRPARRRVGPTGARVGSRSPRQRGETAKRAAAITVQTGPSTPSPSPPNCRPTTPHHRHRPSRHHRHHRRRRRRGEASRTRRRRRHRAARRCSRVGRSRRSPPPTSTLYNDYFLATTPQPRPLDPRAVPTDLRPPPRRSRGRRHPLALR